MDTILTVLPNAATDAGYELGVHLQGIKGTWHRLWGIICLSYSFGNNPDQDDGVKEVRQSVREEFGPKLVASRVAGAERARPQALRQK